jgi:RimJ/RimL family protein N-acetyltransferase
MIDFSQNQTCLRWAEKILGVNFSHTPATWLTAINQQGTILGVVIFSRFTTGNCEVTVVLKDTFLPRLLMLASAAYVFEQLGYRRATAIIAVENERSLKSAQRLGFRIEGRLRDWFPTGDAFILGMLREDFLQRTSHGQPGRTSPPEPSTGR